MKTPFSWNPRLWQNSICLKMKRSLGSLPWRKMNMPNIEIITFFERFDVKTEIPLEDFWPSDGPQWDALGRSNAGSLFLVEAKSHIPEMISSLRAENEDSIRLIHESLEETKRYLNSSVEVDWSHRFYQYTNRLAHLYFLRVLNKMPAYLVFVYFVNDAEQNGPTSVTEWEGAIKLLNSYFGLGRHKLQKYICDVFIDVNALGISWR